MSRKYILVAFICFLLAGYAQNIFDSHTDYFKKRDTFLALPAGNTLKVLSFGNSELVADMLYIWSIQFYSDYNILNSKNFIEDIYNLITDISPRYKDPYLMGSTIMAIEMNEIEMAIRLLQKGAENMKDEWIFDFESGYYTSRYLKDYTLAEKYYKKAAGKKDAPKFISRMLFHSIFMQGKLKESWQLWMSVLENAETEVERHSANLHLYQIKFELDKRAVKTAADRFFRKNGYYPHRLDDLAKAGYLRETPKDFKGNNYQYNNRNGTIVPKEGYMWKR
jgi:hypothetical protein